MWFQELQVNEDYVYPWELTFTRSCPCKISRIFSQKEIEEIRAITLADVIIKSTTISPDEIQRNVFFWKDGDPCPQPMQLNSTVLDPCKYLTGFDYFEVSFSLTCMKWKLKDWKFLNKFLGKWSHIHQCLPSSLSSPNSMCRCWLVCGSNAEQPPPAVQN